MGDGFPEGGRLTGALRRVPAELGADQRSRGLSCCCGSAGIQPPCGNPAAQHVVERQGHLVANCMDGFHPQMGKALHQRVGQARVRLDHRNEARGQASVAVGEVIGHLGRDAERSGSGGIGHRLETLGSPEWERSRPTAVVAPDPSTEAAHHEIDGVGGHASIGGELAAGDGDHAGR